MCVSRGQEKTDITESRILILLDESSSMLQNWTGGREKIKVANDIILKLMDSVYSVNSNVEFSLRVFGNQYTVPEHNCTDTRSEVPFSKFNKTQMEFRLEDLHPLGVTCIAYSLSEAADKDLIDDIHYAYSIVLITDGGESCNGDICGVMAKLTRNKVFFKPYILSLEDLPELKSEYSCMGNYLTVTKNGDISRAVGAIVESYRPMLKLTKKEFTEIKLTNAPSVLKVNIPTKKPVKASDSTVTKPMQVVPETKKQDTVAVKKELPATPIIVGEERKKTQPIKMKALAVAHPRKLFTSVNPFRPKKMEMLGVDVPLLMPEPVVEKPTPANLTAAKISKIKKLKITKGVLAEVPPMPNFLPEMTVEIPEPKREPPARVKLTESRIAQVRKLKLSKPGTFVPMPMATFLPEMTVDIPAPPPVKATAAVLKPIKQKVPFTKLPTTKSGGFEPTRLAVFYADIPVAVPEVKPERPAAAKLTAIKLPAIRKIKTNKPGTYTPLPISVWMADVKVDVPEVKPEAPKRVVEHFAKVKPPQFKMHLLYGGSFFDSDLKPMKLIDAPELKPTIPVVTALPTPKPAAVLPKQPSAKTGEYTVEHEDATATTLEVYLTNGKGKFYQTTPQVFIIDPVSGKEIKKFFRTVDGSGNPDQVTNLPAGKYDLTIAGRDDLLAHVDMQPNKRNKVYVKVKPYSLFFQYAGAPKRPVSEFTAMVIQRNTANGKQVVQKCTDKLEYEPGNYHIIISTFPEEVRNIDLNSEMAEGITLLQPGFVKFTSEVPTTTIMLYRQVGDKFLTFDTRSLKDPVTQHLMIQPGKYQVQYNNGTSKFSSSDKIISFDIKSNEETEVVLKK